MKYLSILLFALFASSCSGTKKAIESQPEATKEIAVAIEVPDAQNVEVEEEVWTEVEEIPINPKKGDIVEDIEVAEDLAFNQDVSKREVYLHDLFDELLKKYVTKNGNVDYKGFKNSHKDLLGYISILTKIYPELDKISQEEKLAYWINAYNALTIDLILRNYPTKSIKDIKDPWDQRLWQFGNKWYNLNDIEHKILRKMNEPRIHFALVCASISCPKLRNEAFIAANLDEQLTNVTIEFLSDSTKNGLSEDHIKLSKIFKWFKKDFEQDGNLIDFLNQYSEVSISSKAKKSFKDYNWDLND